MSTIGARTGGQILVDQLVIHGADLAFCVPGESYLPVLDALYGAGEKIELITCRHESGAANMAEAYGKLTGAPGICSSPAARVRPMRRWVAQIDRTDRIPEFIARRFTYLLRLPALCYQCPP